MADIAASLKDWSTTEASNSPSDATTLGAGMADNLQQIQATVRDVYSRDTIASATTTDIGAKDAGSLTVTGTTTITGFGTVSAGIRKWLTFSGALTLTYNATSMILPTSADLTTEAGDTACFESEGSGNWRCISYTRRSGQSPLNLARFSDGTVSAPGISWNSDTNTGFYRIGADSMGVATNGSNVATFSAGTVAVPTLTGTTATYTNLVGSTSVRSPSVGSASGDLTIYSGSDTYDFDQNGGTALKFEQDGAKFATVGTVSSGTFTAFCIPGAVGGAEPYQFGIGSHPTSGADTGAWSDVLLTAMQGLKIKSSGSISNMLDINADNATTNSIYIFKSGPNPIWRVDTSGATFADGAYSGSGADYAEAFLYVGPKPMPGDSVCLDGDRVRVAADGDDLIGVISESACVIGDSKLLEKGGVAVGLIGKLRVNPGCPVRPEWRKLSGDLYLVK